jgi:hypothetical protein
LRYADASFLVRLGGSFIREALVLSLRIPSLPGDRGFRLGLAACKGTTSPVIGGIRD